MGGSNQDRVFAVLPRTGLANRLFIWGRAAIFADRHGLPLHTHGWGHWHIGPWIRRERSKRFYKPFFRSTSRPTRYGLDKLSSNLGRRRWVVNADRLVDQTEPTTYVFNGHPDKSDYFRDLRSNRPLIKNRLRCELNNRVADAIDQLPTLDVAIHVRRGDFQNLGWQVEDRYYIDLMHRLSESADRTLLFSIFSDSSRNELKEILACPGTEYVDTRGDVIDLWAMSKASIIVTTLKSTFGYWAAFLSEADIILHPEHIYGAIVDDGRFEGTVDQYGKRREKLNRV